MHVYPRGGVLLSCLSSSFSDAATVTRKSNIKSHGTFQSNDATGTQEVLLDSADLRYLADECDKLEQVIAGLSLVNNPNISYTRHHHTGSQYSYGGCYTNGYHVHSGNTYSCGGCHTVGYHVHTSSCPHVHVHNSTCPSHHDHTVGGCRHYHKHTSSCKPKYIPVTICSSCRKVGITGYGATCPHCGGTEAEVIQSATGEYDCNGVKNAWDCNMEAGKVYDCSGVPNTYTCSGADNRWSLSCGNSPNNRYRPACGWNENEIMEAHIVFSK